MNIRVEAGVLSAGAELVESKATVEVLSGDISPVVSSFPLIFQVLTIGGNSISSINPEFNLIGVKAA